MTAPNKIMQERLKHNSRGPPTAPSQAVQSKSRVYLKAKSGRPWLAERRKGDLVVKCHLKAKSGHPWLAERRKGDLVVKCHLKAKSAHRSLARRKSDLVVKGLFEGKERPSLACGTS